LPAPDHMIANTRTFWPIYDWQDQDVWACIANNGLLYNRIYDQYYRYGITGNRMRVSSLIHETAWYQLRRIGAADIVRVQRQAHDAAVLGTFAVERVKLVPDHLLEVIRLAVPGEHAGVVGRAGIGDENEFLAAADIDRPRLVVDDP
jgi:Phosphoadenosine phosphosulfate reductase family